MISASARQRFGWVHSHRYGDLAGSVDGGYGEEPLGISYARWAKLREKWPYAQHKRVGRLPSVPDHIVGDAINLWAQGKMTNRVFKCQGTVFILRGNRLILEGTGAIGSITVARVDRKKNVLEIYGKYARWIRGGRSFPNDWEKLQSRIKRIAGRTVDPKSDLEVCPVYSLPPDARSKLDHTANNHAYDELLLRFNNKMKRAKKHMRFYLTAYSTMCEEAKVYEQVQDVDLGIVIRKEYILESFRNKLG